MSLWSDICQCSVLGGLDDPQILLLFLLAAVVRQQWERRWDNAGPTLPRVAVSLAMMTRRSP
jgi:hypothetical protein